MVETIGSALWVKVVHRRALHSFLFSFRSLFLGNHIVDGRS